MKKLSIILLCTGIWAGCFAGEYQKKDSESARVYVEASQFYRNGEPVFFVGGNTPWDKWNDFGGGFNEEFWENHFKALHDLGVNGTRVWIVCDGKSAVKLNPDGTVKSISDKFWTDLDKFFDIAAKNEIYIMATMMSFDCTKAGNTDRDNWIAMIKDTNSINDFVDNYILKFVNRYKDNPYLFSMDLCNEPDWIFEHDKISWEDLSNLFSREAAAIHENSKILTTVGIAMTKYVKPTPYLDFYSPHHYGWETKLFKSPFFVSPSIWLFDTIKPIVVGECSAKSCDGHTLAEDYIWAYTNGYSGVFVWTTNGVDANGGLEDLTNGVNGFHTWLATAQQQSNDQRTNETKIADAVMQLPAKDTEMQNQLMQELIRLDNVIPSLASKLLPPGDGDDSQIRAAISGLAVYASQGNNPADKKKIVEELSKALQGVESNEIKDFLSTQLQYVTGEKALPAYILETNSPKNTPEQKLLLLRNALEIAQTPAQKEEIIRQIAQTGTFLGMITASKYVNDPNQDVQKAAVQTVNTIALTHPGYKDFVSIFNGKDLTGWKGLVENPIIRSKMTPAQLAQKQKIADEVMRRDWKVENGMLVYEGTGFDNLCSDKMYGDIEMYVDWKIAPEGDAGIYLRGSPQVQIWDTARTEVGAQVGSGGLYNNQKYESKPLVVADNPVNEWNSFYIRMEGDKVTVNLNGQLVTDNTILENYWDRSLPIFPEEAIELQAHGNRVEYRDLYVREIPHPKLYEVSEAEKKEGFVPLFNGIDLTGWIGNLRDYFAKDGTIICDPERGGHGNLYTENEYSDFIVRFEFMLTPAANNGLGIRAPLEGDAAYVGMELQILDNDAEVYKDLHTYQYHGSVYGVIPAKRGFLKPVGEWNYEEVIAKGNKITITLNGTVILDGDIAEASKNFTATIDGNQHPGLSNKSGHIGFLGHGSWVAFRNLRIKKL